MKITRFNSGSKGRSNAVSFDKLIWLVSNARTTTLDLKGQVNEMFSLADNMLEKAGSDKSHMLSVQIFLTDINSKNEFDVLWNEWVGSNPDNWPQRVCIEAKLSPGLLVEMQMTAVKK